METKESVLGSSETDSELLSQVATGDQEALKQLYDRYAAHLNNFVRNYLADPNEAADIVHEAMLDVWRTADRFRGGSTVKSWMFSIAERGRICIEGPIEIQYSAIHLAFYEDLSYSQIAEIEDCPTGTVKTRIMAAKSALMRCLQRSE